MLLSDVNLDVFASFSSSKPPEIIWLEPGETSWPAWITLVLFLTCQNQLRWSGTVSQGSFLPFVLFCCLYLFCLLRELTAWLVAAFIHHIFSEYFQQLERAFLKKGFVIFKKLHSLVFLFEFVSQTQTWSRFQCLSETFQNAFFAPV